jgi:hypothetical protein
MTKRLKMVLVSVAAALLLALGVSATVPGLVAGGAASPAGTEIAGRFGGGYS